MHQVSRLIVGIIDRNPGEDRPWIEPFNGKMTLALVQPGLPGFT